MKVVVFFIAVILCGCAAFHGESDVPQSSCIVDLSNKTKVYVIPDSIESKYKKDLSGWFKEDNGDYFYCLDRISENTCGNQYEIHWHVNDVYSEYKGEEILCMQ